MTTTNLPRSPRSTLRCCLPVKVRLDLGYASETSDGSALQATVDASNKTSGWVEMGEKRVRSPVIEKKQRRDLVLVVAMSLSFLRDFIPFICTSGWVPVGVFSITNGRPMRLRVTREKIVFNSYGLRERGVSGSCLIGASSD